MSRLLDLPFGSAIHLPISGDEVVQNAHHRCGRLDMREVPDTGEHLESATRHRVLSGVAVGDRNDPVLTR